MIFVIYHNADFDGEFCHQIARKFLGDEEVQYIGWNYGNPDWDFNGLYWDRGDDEMLTIQPTDQVYILDLSVAGLMNHPNLVWIDHHKTAIDKYAGSIKGYRIDGVAACRLAWQWFNKPSIRGEIGLIVKDDFVNHDVDEPWAVRLAGEYDVWDKRDTDCERFQHGLRAQELTLDLWADLLNTGGRGIGRCCAMYRE